jgi:hypothetical protein
MNIHNLPKISTLEIALGHLSKFPDHYIFPIKRDAKSPPCIPNNLAAGSNDPAQIKRWHAKWPGCNWGVALAKSGLIVVDVDCKPGKVGAATYSMLGLLNEWPETFSVRTPSGGLHHYYSGKHVFALGVSGFGLDIDSPNYSLISGCTVKGKPYLIDGDLPIAAAPEWFGRYLRQREHTAATTEPVVNLDQPANVEWAAHYLKFDAPPAIEGQGGELTTLKVAAELRDHGISEHRAVDLMNEYYNVIGKCDPEWEIEGLRQKVQNAFNYAHLNAPGERTVEAEFADSPNPFPVEEQQSAKAERKVVYTLDNLVKDWVWIVEQHRFVRRRDGRLWDVQSFDSKYNHLMPKSASISKALFKMRARMPRLDCIVFRPGQDEVLGDLYNTWRPSPVIPAQGDTSVWNEHLAYLFPNETDRDHVLNWMAWVYQHQAEKPNFALLLVGETIGTGKSFLARVFRFLIGPANTKKPKNSSLRGDFNGWALQCKLAIIEELMQIGKREVGNELRDIITEPTVEVNIKNIPAFETENYIAMMAISNHPDAMPLDQGDRRWLVVETEACKHPDPDVYYARLFKILRDQAALSAIAHELQQRQVPMSFGLGEAPITAAKLNMIEQSQTQLESELANMDILQELELISIADDIIPALSAEARQSRAGSNLNRIARWLKRNVGGVKLPRQRVGKDFVTLFAINGGAEKYRDKTPHALGHIYTASREAFRRAGPVAVQDDDAVEEFTE